MKIIKKNKISELSYSENFLISGDGIFKEGSFVNVYLTATSSSYRDFKAFLSK